MNIHPSGETFTRLAYVGWGLVLIEMAIDVAPIKLFLGLLAMSSVLSICAAIRYHGISMEAATKNHAGVMGKQVFSAERWATNRWRGEALAHLDAAAMYSSNGNGTGTGPFRMARDSKT